MESAKIVLACVLAAVTYGVVNNLITANLCIDFFKLFDIGLNTTSPVNVAITYGVRTTWWVGIVVGLLLAGAARLGNGPKIALPEILPSLFKLMGILAGVALLVGSASWLLWAGIDDRTELDRIFEVIPPEARRMAFAVNAAHTVDYFGGLIGGIVLCFGVINRRRVAVTPASSVGAHVPEMTRVDVALSFAGEDRRHADRIAELLTAEGFSVFYDKYEQATLWGKNLYSHLSDVYQHKARFCLIFISAHYARKLWTKRELQAAQARAFRENTEYILPLRIDDTELPGIEQIVGYIDLRQVSHAEVVGLLTKKLGDSKTVKRS